MLPFGFWGVVWCRRESGRRWRWHLCRCRYVEDFSSELFCRVKNLCRFLLPRPKQRPRRRRWIRRSLLSAPYAGGVHDLLHPSVVVLPQDQVAQVVQRAQGEAMWRPWVVGTIDGRHIASGRHTRFGAKQVSARRRLKSGGRNVDTFSRPSRPRPHLNPAYVSPFLSFSVSVPLSLWCARRAEGRVDP